jgi:tetratricopeptide (TPR) repeat protein
MADHYDVETLEDYARGALDPRAGSEVGAHIAECDRCRDFVVDEQMLGDFLRDERVWQVADIISDDAPADFSRLRTVAEGVAAEDREARALLKEALTSPEAFQKAEVGTRHVYETKGVVRHLCATAKALRDSNPKFARLVAADAARIAYRAEWPLLRVDALTELGCALIRLGKLSKAEEVLVAAERSLDAAGQNDLYAKALLWYSRAVVARDLRRFDEALELSEKAAAIFQEIDARMLSATMFMTAAVLFAKRRFAEAAEKMEALLASGHLDAERDMRAMALHNAGAMHLRAGHNEAALLRLSEAAAMFEELGQKTWRATSDWWLALLLTRFGAYEEAAEALETAQAELRRLGLSNEAALAALDLAEALLLIGEKHRAAEVCKEVVLVFTAADMQREANRAVAYIREAIESGAATPQEVREVRFFLEDLPNRPANRPS